MTHKESYLSGLVVAHNEEKNLKACLDTLQFCNELIVVLDRCTDSSEKIAKEAGAKILKGTWPIEGNRRNEGIAACKGPWILELDADEHISIDLAKEIKKAIKNPSEAAYFTIPVDNYIGRHCVRYGWGAYFGVGSVKRLFKKGAKIWGNQRIHPRITFTGKEGYRFSNRLIHYVDKDISDMIVRLNRYTTARAEDMRESGELKSETLQRNVRRIFSRFYKCYIRKKGYKEGAYGFLIALCAGLYPILSYLKATLEKEKNDHVKD